MKNVLKAALVLGTLGTPMLAFAGEPVGAPPAGDKAAPAAPAPSEKPVAKDAKGAKDAKDAKGAKKESAPQVKAN